MSQHAEKESGPRQQAQRQHSDKQHLLHQHPGSHTMTFRSYYCDSPQCRRTTRRFCVRMNQRTYYYCVECGRRLELRPEYDKHARRAS